MSQIYAGAINGPLVGIVVKEIVRRAMVAIRNRRMAFEVSCKDGYDGGNMNDVFTNADTAAQAIYLHLLRECFPHCGIVAEEGALSIPGSDGCTAYFTVDPLDGTKAFIRRQTHGVGTMIALVESGAVTCAFIGDINAEVVYYFRPDSPKAYQVSRLDVAEELTYHTPLVPGEAYALLREPPQNYLTDVSGLVGDRTIFKSYNIDTGSIGVWAARLWRREVQALFLPPGWETPWDSSPVIGISQKLGYVFLEPSRYCNGWDPYQPLLAPEKYWRPHCTMIVHKNDLSTLYKKGVVTCE